MKLRFVILVGIGLWALVFTILCAANKQPKRSIGCAVIVALCTLGASRTWDAIKIDAEWEALKKHPRH